MNEKAYKKQLEDQLKDEAYYSKEKAPKLYPEINENHGTKKLNKLLGKVKNMSIEDYRGLYKRAMRDERDKIKDEFANDVEETDSYIEWLEVQLIELRQQFHSVNEERIKLIIEKHERNGVDKWNVDIAMAKESME